LSESLFQPTFVFVDLMKQNFSGFDFTMLSGNSVL